MMHREENGNREDAKKRVIAASGAILVFMVLGVIVEIICSVSLAGKLTSLIETVQKAFPEDEYGEVHVNPEVGTPNVFQHLFNLVLGSVVPLAGIYGAMHLKPDILNAFGFSSLCCGCTTCFCEVAPPCCVLVFLGIISGVALPLVQTCDMSVACPLDGKSAEVLDCVASSVWYDDYKRHTKYGTPFTEDMECPPLWLNCSQHHIHESGSHSVHGNSSFRILGDTDARPAAWHSAVMSLAAVGIPGPRLGVPHASLRALGSGLLNASSSAAAWRGDGTPARRLSDDSEKPWADLFKDLPTPVQPKNVSECVVQEETIKAMPIIKEFLTEVQPTLRVCLTLLFAVKLALSLACCYAGTIGIQLAKDVQGNRYSSMQPMVQGSSIVQGTIVQPGQYQGYGVQGTVVEPGNAQSFSGYGGRLQ